MDKPATGPWRTDEPPKDGSVILAMLSGEKLPDAIYWLEDLQRWEDRDSFEVVSEIVRWAEINIGGDDG